AVHGLGTVAFGRSRGRPSRTSLGQGQTLALAVESRPFGARHRYGLRCNGNAVAVAVASGGVVDDVIEARRFILIDDEPRPAHCGAHRDTSATLRAHGVPQNGSRRIGHAVAVDALGNEVTRNA